MAPLPLFFRFTFYFLLFASSLFASSYSHRIFLSRRNLLDTNSKKNQTKLIKPSSSSSSSKNQTISSSNSNSSKKNQTKLAKPISKTSSKNVGAPPNTVGKPKVNSTKSSDPLKSKSITKNKTKSSPSSTPTTKLPSSDTKSDQNQKQKQKQKLKSPSPPTWMQSQDDDNDTDYDFMAEFRDLSNKFHQTFIPDMHRFSTTSKMYITKANKEITQSFIKPYVSKQYHSSASTAISFAFIIVPFLLVSLLFNRITAYFSLQKLLIFIQIYLSIYFSILCFSSLITGLEPLRFFYATSQSTYVWLQVLQTLGYVMYLLMLLMYLILVFSTESGLGQKFLGLAQTFVGFAVGFHYYMTVFHRVVLHLPPKTNWKVHGIYATCFLVICLLARADRTKKAYHDEEGVEEGKIN
ncbi:hypothetical protein SOVF_086530 [Spinacia oleracea]|uniref:Uncharacterized protein n=1 Tax=Spinacia oleracea TaxID=3562 RepID=A0A9R0JYR9_SPIOL|nr:uncharacterized protein LOC110791058 [Spinacia oleracea]KNA16715.1 hypothetical protein SOVF_086530 [Spinacia oleracea]